jgi:uncharacterized DUF497 family protein
MDVMRCDERRIDRPPYMYIIHICELFGTPQKQRATTQKQRVHLADAEVALFDPFGLTREDVSSQGERRFVTIGIDATGTIVVAVFTPRGDEVRLISSRKATKRERAQYAEGIRL